MNCYLYKNWLSKRLVSDLIVNSIIILLYRTTKDKKNVFFLFLHYNCDLIWPDNSVDGVPRNSTWELREIEYLKFNSMLDTSRSGSSDL